MPTGTPQMLLWRVAPLMFIAATLIGTMFSAPVIRAQNPPAEGTVRLIPALSNVPADAGPFTVYVIGQDILHLGAITYDDNRDGTPDRSITSNGMAAFQITIAYDPAVLAVRAVEPGPELGRTGRSFQCLPPDEKPGSFTFGCLSEGSAPGGTQGTLTLASFELVPQGPGLSPLALDAALAGPLGDGITVAVDGGAARVTGAISAVPTNTPPAASRTLAPGPSSTLRPGSPGSLTPAQTLTQTPFTKTATPVGNRPTQPGGSHSFAGVALWSVIGAAVITAVGGLLAAVMLRRGRRHRGGT